MESGMAAEKKDKYQPKDVEMVRQLLRLIGEDPDREGLQETPLRFLKAMAEYTKGYREKPENVLKVFEDGGEGVDEMVIVRDIPVYSLCEHHLAPFFGKAYVGYVPDKKILGLSKISRLVEVYSRRLQVQERLTNQIADALAKHLQPLGVAVVIECRHLCMESRGVKHAGSSTVTSALRGSIKKNADTRKEFLSLIGH
jgi:GTP cyclohydrolase I